MSFRERLADLVRGKKLEPVQNSTPLSQITTNSSTWDAFVDPFNKLQGLSEHTAMSVSAIYACVNLIAGAIATLPLNIYRMDISTGERDRVFGDPLNWVFNEQMTARWSSAIGWEFMVMALLLHGDAFARIVRDSYGVPIGMEPIHPRRTFVQMTPDRLRLVYIVTPEIVVGMSAQQIVGSTMVYDQDDIVHVPGFGFNGTRGLSALRWQLRTSGAMAMAMQDFAANFFANAARPDYALQTDQKLSQDAVDALRAKIDEVHRGPDNAHRPMLLHSGLKFEAVTMPLEDMQLLGMREFQIEEIARIYGVPPFMIGHNEKTTSWGSGVESMGIGFVRYTLNQHLNKIENEINRKMFRTASRVVEFDTTDLERADTKAFYEGLRIAVGRAGEPQLITINEARAEMRRKKVPGMDTLQVNPPAAGAPPNGTQQAA